MRQDVKNQLADKVHQYIQQHRLIKPSDRVLVAFSGGPDSTALLHVLHVLIPDLGFNLEALHIMGLGVQKPCAMKLFVVILPSGWDSHFIALILDQPHLRQTTGKNG